MVVEHKGTKYRVSFSHERNDLDPTSEHGAETYCYIRELNPDGRQESKLLASGCARCSQEDQFCKETGRTLSLRRALSSKWNFHLDRGFRTAVWHAYFDRKGKACASGRTSN